MPRIDDIRNSYGKYFLAMNQSYKYYPYQQEKIVPALQLILDGVISKLAIFMSPGDSKSDLTTRNFPPFYLGKFPDRNVMVCSYGADLASDDFGAKIKARMESELHLKIFPDSKLTKDSRSKTHFTTVKDGNFYSVGYTGGITGKRLNLIILDDLIKNWEEAESETTQQALFDTYAGVIKDRMRPGGAIVMCAHRWTPRDVYKRILDDDGTIEEGGDWFVVKLPAEDPPGCGTYLWEEFHGKKHYEDFKRKDDKIWWGKFQQEPSRAQDFKFKEQWLNFYDVAPPANRFKNYLFCDPAASKTRTSDFTEMQVYAAAEEEKLILVDWIHDRLHPGERQKALDRMFRKYHPEIALYEEYGLVCDTAYFNEAARTKGFDVFLTPVGKSGPRHNLAKHHRIEELIPWYEEGRIILPRKFPYKMANGQEVDLTHRFIEEEYKLYRGEKSIPHEDALDCQSRINDVMAPWGPGFDWYVPENERPERRVIGHAGSWEAVY
jgi:hypothetical protein